MSESGTMIIGSTGTIWSQVAILEGREIYRLESVGNSPVQRQTPQEVTYLPVANEVSE